MTPKIPLKDYQKAQEAVKNILAPLKRVFPDIHGRDMTSPPTPDLVWGNVEVDGETKNEHVAYEADVTLIEGVAHARVLATDEDIFFVGYADWLDEPMEVNFSAQSYLEGFEQAVKHLMDAFLCGYKQFLQKHALEAQSFVEDKKRAAVLRVLNMQLTATLEDAPSRWKLDERQTWCENRAPRAGELVYIINWRDHSVSLGRVKEPSDGGFFGILDLGPAKFNGTTLLVPDTKNNNYNRSEGRVTPRTEATDMMAASLVRMHYLYDRECDRRNTLVADMAKVFKKG